MNFNFSNEQYIEHKNLSLKTNFWNNYLVNYVLGS